MSSHINITGDTTRQAIDSLAGYAYQLYASALAWLSLKDDEELYLEVAEDYAIAAKESLTAVQVKKNKTPLTINNPGIIQAIQSYVELVELNPSRSIYITYLSTASIGKERNSSHQITGEGALHYWSKVAKGADVKPLQMLLQKVGISDKVKLFLLQLDEHNFREKFIKNIRWECDQSDIDGIEELLKIALIQYGDSTNKYQSSEVGSLIYTIIGHLLGVITKPGSLRRLLKTDLIQLLDSATSITIPKHTLSSLLSQLSSALNLPNSGGSLSTDISNYLYDISNWPLPRLLNNRTHLIQEICGALPDKGVVILTGLSGMGKTVSAQMCARALGGTWLILDLRDVLYKDAATRLHSLIKQINEIRPAGVIIDDINIIDDRSLRLPMIALLETLKHHNVLCIMTSYQYPAPSTLSFLDIHDNVHMEMPLLSLDEITELITDEAPGNEKWAKTIMMMSGGGHPLFVQASLRMLQSNNWKEISDALGRRQIDLSEVIFKIIPSSLEDERRRVQNIIRDFNEPTKLLLYRLSLICGSFDKAMVDCLAAASPKIAMPGDCLSSLVGVWVESLPNAEYRISPLVSNAGKNAMSEAEQRDIHNLIANQLTSKKNIDGNRIDNIIMHGMLGNANEALTKLMIGIISLNSDGMKFVAKNCVLPKGFQLDKPILQSDSNLSLLLRSVQFLVLLEDENNSNVSTVWECLSHELEIAPDLRYRNLHKFFVLSKSFINADIVNKFDNWLDLLLQLIDLMGSDEEIGSIVSAAESALKKENGLKLYPNTLAGIMLASQSIHINSIEKLSNMFEKLNTMPSVSRQKILNGIDKLPSLVVSIVESPWIHERIKKNLSNEDIACSYKQLALLAANWEYKVFAERCHIIQAAILDEDLKDPLKALNVIEDAKNKFGDSIYLEYALAKIRLNSDQYEQAWAHFENIMQDEPLSDFSEYAFRFRHAGECAGKLGRWNVAYGCFEKAYNASLQLASDAIRATSIGLLADMAIAAYHMSETRRCVSLFSDSLKALEELPFEQTNNSKYCHRIIRHAILWVFSQLTKHKFEVDGRPAMMWAGMCSWPSGDQEKPGILPLPLLNVSWYILASIDILVHGIPSSIEAELHKRLNHKLMPLMEVDRLKAYIYTAIKTSDSSLFVKALFDYLSAMFFVETRVNSEGEISLIKYINFECETIPPISIERLVEPQIIAAVDTAILCFGIGAAINRSQSALVELLHNISKALPEGSPCLISAQILSVGNHGSEYPDNEILHLLRTLSLEGMLHIKELLLFSIRIIEKIYSNHLKLYINDTDSICIWILGLWQAAIKEQTFNFRSPSYYAPNIEQIISDNIEPLQKLSKLVESAEKMIGAKYSPEIKAALKNIISGKDQNNF